MKALVLAGGKGTRLRPLTYTMSKQLIPIANRPVLHYVMDHLQRAGIRDVGVIIDPDTGDDIRASLAAEHWPIDFTFIPQEKPLGLAHAILVARDFLGNEPFVMYLGDNLIAGGVKELVAEFRSARADGCVYLKEVRDPARFGVAVLDGDGRIAKLVEKPKEPVSNLALVGVYCFSPAIHEAVRSIRPSWRGELEITDALQHLLDRGRRVVSKRLEGWWLDCGKKDDLLEANRRVLEEWIQRDIRGTADAESSIAGRVALGPGADVRRSEIRGPAVIGPGTRVEGSSVGPYTSIGRGCSVQNSAVENCVVLDGARVENVARLGESILGRNAVVRQAPGERGVLRLLVGDDAEVVL